MRTNDSDFDTALIVEISIKSLLLSIHFFVWMMFLR